MPSKPMENQQHHKKKTKKTTDGHQNVGNNNKNVYTPLKKSKK